MYQKKHVKCSHLIAIYVFSNNIVYFDSFGVQCYVHSICEYLQKYDRKIIQSLVTIQHPLSLHCAYFCIGFILAVEIDLTLSLYQQMFNSVHLLQNDEMVCDFMVKILEMKKIILIF